MIFTELEVIPLKRLTQKSDPNLTQSLFKVLTTEEVDTIMLTLILNFDPEIHLDPGSTFKGQDTKKGSAISSHEINEHFQQFHNEVLEIASSMRVNRVIEIKAYGARHTTIPLKTFLFKKFINF